MQLGLIGLGRMGGNMRERIRAAGHEVIRQKPEGMAITTHTCRGNYRSSWSAQGGYDAIAEPLFAGLEVDGFFVEYDDDEKAGRQEQEQ